MPNLAVVRARIAGHYRSIPDPGRGDWARCHRASPRPTWHACMASVPWGEFSGLNNTTEGCPVKVGNFNVTHYVKQFFLGTYQVQIVVFLSPYSFNCRNVFFDMEVTLVTITEISCIPLWKEKGILTESPHSDCVKGKRLFSLRMQRVEIARKRGRHCSAEAEVKTERGMNKPTKGHFSSDSKESSAKAISLSLQEREKLQRNRWGGGGVSASIRASKKRRHISSPCTSISMT